MIVFSLFFIVFGNSFKGFYLFIFRRGQGVEKEGEKRRCERETFISWPLYMALTGEQSWNPGVCPD